MILFLIFSKICSLLPSSLSITTPNTKSQIPKPPKFPNRKRMHITKIIIHKRIQNKQINRVRRFLRLSSSRGGRALQVRTHRSFLSRPFHLFTSSKETKKPKKKPLFLPAIRGRRRRIRSSKPIQSAIDQSIHRFEQI